MSRRVLIVDDNPSVRRALRQFFTTAGDFSVCGEAENGREAIERAQQLQPDLVITDFVMPVMNGLEEARLLKQLMPSLPVIIYTAHGESCFQKEVRSAGIVVVSKSEAVTTLIETARNLFRHVAA